jgi:Cyclophilin type peptidyl-prolyl cis-trans isomerase/CLD
MATRSFVIEMAPLDLMPHAVHLFLEQVDHGLWTNAWFYINGPHVIQGGPKVNDDGGGALHSSSSAPSADERAVALAPFRNLQLDQLAFSEYSPQYPHRPWTLGYTGRPGGPDFYINKVDNVEAHGPGGQFHHELEEFADACFARVIKGFDTLEDMTHAPTVRELGEYQYYYEVPVQIVKMAIVGDPLHPKIKLEKGEPAVEENPDDEEPVDQEPPIDKDTKTKDTSKQHARLEEYEYEDSEHFTQANESANLFEGLEHGFGGGDTSRRSRGPRKSRSMSPGRSRSY